MKANFIKAAVDAAEKAAAEAAEKTGEEIDRSKVRRNGYVGAAIGVLIAAIVVYWLKT